MIAIHTVHRRLAELHIKAARLGGYWKLSYAEQLELAHCLHVNADLVQRIDGLKELSFQAHVIGDMGWAQELSGQLDELEAKLT